MEPPRLSVIGRPTTEKTFCSIASAEHTPDRYTAYGRRLCSGEKSLEGTIREIFTTKSQ